MGVGLYKNAEEAFSTLKKVVTVIPEKKNEIAGLEAYERWLTMLKR